MKITEITIDPLITGRSLVRIHTDEGITGLAEAGRAPLVFKAYLEQSVNALMIGQDPMQIERHWERLSLGVGDMTIRHPSQIVGIIDIALWDIFGKATGLPVYTLMGGATRKKIQLYWSQGNGWKKQPEDMRKQVETGLNMGFSAFKIRMDWKDYRQDSDPRKDFAMFKLCREFLPEEMPLGFDANNGYSVSTAIEQGVKMQELGIAHFEEPLPQYDYPGYRQVVDALDVAISTGELDTGRWHFRDLIALGNPDILQPDILNAGGPSEVKRIYEMALVANKPIMPHSPTAGINSMASLHAYSTIKNATRPHEFSLEFSPAFEDLERLFVDPLLPKDGHIELSDGPGYGLEINEKELPNLIANI